MHNRAVWTYTVYICACINIVVKVLGFGGTGGEGFTVFRSKLAAQLLEGFNRD